MSQNQQEIKENYERNLKAKDYIVEMTAFWDELPNLFRFMLMSIHEAFNSSKFKGSKVLEIGSGATVHSIASASKYFDTIVQTDYVEDNLEELRRWLRGESPFRQLLDIQAGLEGYGNRLEEGRSIIESRIRKRVKMVTRCDILTDDILLGQTNHPETSPPYDVVLSCLCLETVPVDVEGYKTVLKRINRLLRPGGGILICGYFQGNLWKVAETLYHHIRMSEKELLNALSDAGFGRIEIKAFHAGKTEINYYDYEKMFCATAEKIAEIVLAEDH